MKPTQTLLDQIIAGAGDYADIDMPMNRCCEAYCADNGLPSELAPLAAQLWFEREAISHGIPLSVVRGERGLSQASMLMNRDTEDAYDLDDPKHPTYRERMLDAADARRKSDREDI